MGASNSAQVGGGTLFSEPVLVFNQKAKLVEVNAEYAVFNQGGLQIGAVREVGQSFMKKAVGGPPQRRTHTLQVVDMHGRVLIRLNRPAKLFRSKMVVADADGAHIGQIAQKSLDIVGAIGFNIHFNLESEGHRVGSILAEGQQGWGCGIQDAAGNEIARITRSWAGLAKEMFTKADNYVLQIHRPLEEPLRSLVIAGAVAVDTALRQSR